MASFRAVAPMSADQGVRSPGRAAAAARLVRLFSMGATISYALVGSATSTRSASILQVLGYLALGMATHVHAAIFNDVIDFPIDRTEPRRMDSPLVRGDVSRAAAAGVAMASFAVSAALMLALGAAREAWLAWFLAIGLVDVYTLIGKRVRWAVISDAVQGVGTACFVWVGAALTGEVTAATVAAMSYVAGYVMMVNGVHGTVRDMANDAARGARTTALMFGAHVDESGAAVLPRAFIGWAASLQVWLLASTATVFLLARSELSAPAAVGSAFTGMAFGVLLVRYGNAALASRADRDAMMAYGTWHLVFGLALLVGVVAWLMPWWMAVITLTSFVLPPKAFGWAVATDSAGSKLR